MSIDFINNNPALLRAWIDRVNRTREIYLENNPDSLIPCFENELRDLGFVFEISNQTFGFMPKYKKEILPIAIRYYILSRQRGKDNEQNHFLHFFHFKGFEEVVPMLIEDYYSPSTPDLTRWLISDCLYKIKSKNFIDQYLDIISNPEFSINRQMIILLVGKLKVERAIPILIDLLEDEYVRLHAICALGNYKREEFRCYFERFENSEHSGWRKYAKTALKKLNS